MNHLKIKSDSRVPEVFENYPEEVRKKMQYLRTLVLETAQETSEITELEETLKWGEPSYLAKKGSTLRMDWKSKKPQQYALYFKCTSKLVPSFKVVYKDLFTYEGDRAIVFQMDEAIPVAEIKKCISAALTYHIRKHLPLLGL